MNHHFAFLPVLVLLPLLPANGQLVAWDGFEIHPAGAQLESGANNSSGTGLNGGTGWGGAYNVSNAIKSLVKIEDRSATPVIYSNGQIALHGGLRALRFSEIANGSPAVVRPLGTVFSAAAGEAVWFSLLFRTASASLLPDQDFFQIGFDNNANASSGNPRVSVGVNTVSTTFPPSQPFQFFVRSTTSTAANANTFVNGPAVQAVTTYLLVGCIEPHTGQYDQVSLWINPSDPTAPGTASATVVLPSGISSLSHFFLRTAFLDSGDVYVVDEIRIGRDFGSVVLPPSLEGILGFSPAVIPDQGFVVRWPASVTGVTLETSATLEDGSWAEITAPFTLQVTDYQFAVPAVPAIPSAFFRLRR